MYPRPLPPKYSIGDKVKKFTVLEYIGVHQYKGGSRSHLYLCRCECGNTKKITQNQLNSKDTLGCGCLAIKQVKVGDRFGMLEVISEVPFNERPFGKRMFNCICDCGKKCIKQLSLLNIGRTKSCGCYQKTRAITHGLSGTKFNYCYSDIISRCNNKNNKYYNLYGGRGITCERNSFEEFKEDMYDSYLIHCELHGKRNTSIERINNDGNYCKENCKWATAKEQQRNKSNKSLILYNGDLVSTRDLAKKAGILHSTLINRLRRGWDIERALKKNNFKYKDGRIISNYKQ